MIRGLRSVWHWGACPDTWQCAVKKVPNHRGGSQCFGPGPARPPNPSLLSTGPWAGPAPQALTFIDSAVPTRPTNPSLLSTGPGQLGHPTPHFYWPTPHLYWPDPSLLSAKPARANPQNCEPPRTTGATALRQIANINCTLPCSVLPQACQIRSVLAAGRPKQPVQQVRSLAALGTCPSSLTAQRHFEGRLRVCQRGCTSKRGK